jgi:hypothetical protein
MAGLLELQKEAIYGLIATKLHISRFEVQNSFHPDFHYFHDHHRWRVEYQLCCHFLVHATFQVSRAHGQLVGRDNVVNVFPARSATRL